MPTSGPTVPFPFQISVRWFSLMGIASPLCFHPSSHPQGHCSCCLCPPALAGTQVSEDHRIMDLMQKKLLQSSTFPVLPLCQQVCGHGGLCIKAFSSEAVPFMWRLTMNPFALLYLSKFSLCLTALMILPNVWICNTAKNILLKTKSSFLQKARCFSVQ